MVILCCLSLLAAQIGSVYRPTPTFFLLHSRIWELLIGSIASLLLARNSIERKALLTREILSGMGFIFIGIAIFLFDKKTPFPSAYALLPTTGAALIILCGQPDTQIGKVLCNNIVVFIGKISYGAYLWHLPVLVFSRYHFGNFSTSLSVALMLLTFLLSAASWRYVEQPFRNKEIVSSQFILLFSVVGGFLIVAFGYTSHKVFSTASEFGIESKAAIELASADAVYSPNMDERVFINSRIHVETMRPDTIVLGSSRIMQVGEHNYSHKVLNLGVSGASVEDDLTIAYLATRKFTPTTLIISADPWLFNKNSGQTRWKSLLGDYADALSFINIPVTGKSTSTEAGKAPPFLKIYSSIYTAINNQALVAGNDASETRDKIRRDGSRVYNTEYSQRSQQEIASEFQNLLYYAMNDYEFSSDSYEKFARFIDVFSKKYTIVLILSPYHPKLYARIKTERPIYLEIESFFRDFSNTHNVTIIGSYDPERVDCQETEFYDGMHPKDSCLGKILTTLSR
jgi:Acyltransferase family